MPKSAKRSFSQKGSIYKYQYINQDNKDPGEVQPQHLISQSGVLLLTGRAKEGECEVI